MRFGSGESFASVWVLCLFLSGCGGRGLVETQTPSAPSPPVERPIIATTPIKHVVMLYQENRSFDSYFGKLGEYRASKGLAADIDGLPVNASNPSFDGKSTVRAFAWKSVCHENVSPLWQDSHTQVNRNDPGGAASPMDGFVFAAGRYARNLGLKDVNGLRAMGYYDQRALPYYYELATQFATSDRFFSPVLSRSAPNRMYGLAGTSAGFVHNPTTAVPNKTIFHLLEERGIPWKVYYSDLRADGKPVSFMQYFQPFFDQHQDKFRPASEFFADAAAGRLPAVALVESGYASGRDEHPANNIQVGANYARTFIDALMASPQWRESVFFLTYDEGGGLYDHVPPPAAVHPDGVPPRDLLTFDVREDFTRYGLRVPLTVISPFTKKHYVSHIPTDATAFLKFIERNYSLPSLTARDAAAHDLMDFFDFQNPPWLTPPALPAQPQDMPCYHDRIP